MRALLAAATCVFRKIARQLTELPGHCPSRLAPATGCRRSECRIGADL